MVRSFVDFALSKAGQSVVAANGFVEQNVKSEAVNVVAEAPPDYKRLTEGAERLSLNFRFRPASSALDNKALPDLDRVSSFISDLKYSGKDLMLFGFADGAGSKDANCRLSKERAQAVSDQLSQRGLNPATVNGFCSELAVASNDNEDGREKNRRVEVWLRKH
jgi:phosphate transport system substrate-binding protein